MRPSPFCHCKVNAEAAFFASRIWSLVASNEHATGKTVWGYPWVTGSHGGQDLSCSNCSGMRSSPKTVGYTGTVQDMLLTSSGLMQALLAPGAEQLAPGAEHSPCPPFLAHGHLSQARLDRLKGGLWVRAHLSVHGYKHFLPNQSCVGQIFLRTVR